MRHYLGDAARAPGDIDWVVLPPSVRVDSRSGVGLLEAMKNEISTVVVEGMELHAGQAEHDTIWTYDRVPGRRLTIPWTGADGLTGHVQMDFVYGEELWIDPIEVSTTSGGSLIAAGPEQSLGWKLLWLATDCHPQGKDLYDAVLLAERFGISTQLRDRALSEGARPGYVPSREHLMDWTFHGLEWDDFVVENPRVTGSAERWVGRLADAIFPETAGD